MSTQRNVQDLVAHRFMPFLTAEEAFPALEACFLEARKEICGGFRIFDPDTRLRTDRARVHGTDWGDLIAATLARGVAIRLTLADFDPIARPELHRIATRSVRRFQTIAEQAKARLGDEGGILVVRATMHPMRVGWLPRLVLLPKIRRELAAQCRGLNELEAAERVRKLDDMPALRRCLVRQPDGTVRPARFGFPPLVPATHHHKVAVFDRARLWIGGLDVNERRYDTLSHKRNAAQTWHDTQVLVNDPALASEAHQHLLRFERETAGTLPPAPHGQLLRTVSRRRRLSPPFLSPRTVVATLRAAHLSAIAGANDLIYLENQFLRDKGIARALADRARQRPTLRLLAVLPAAPEDIAFDDDHGIAMQKGEHLQTECIRMIADAFGPRAIIASPAQPRSAENGDRDLLGGAPIIYVHSKLMVVDEADALVSSANLNGRSFDWDTEIGVRLTEKDEVRLLLDRCLAHWMRWRDVSRRPQLWERIESTISRDARTRPQEREGFLLPYRLGPALEDALAVPVLPDAIV